MNQYTPRRWMQGPQIAHDLRRRGQAPALRSHQPPTYGRVVLDKSPLFL